MADAYELNNLGELQQSSDDDELAELWDDDENRAALAELDEMYENAENLGDDEMDALAEEDFFRPYRGRIRPAVVRPKPYRRRWGTSKPYRGPSQWRRRYRRRYLKSRK